MSGDLTEVVTRLRRLQSRMGTSKPGPITAVPTADLAAVLDAIDELHAERQAVLDVINIYGDEVLHSALDDIGFVPRLAGTVDPQ